jgi:DNA-binding CsgD family transcriptional regulator
MLINLLGEPTLRRSVTNTTGGQDFGDWGDHRMSFGSTLSVVREADAADSWLVAWSELEPRCRLVLAAADRRLMWANGHAEQALAAGRDLVLRRGVVETADPRHLREFDKFIAGTRPQLSTWSAQRPDGDGDAVFAATRLNRSDEPPVVGLSFHGTGSDFAPQWADFAASARLTTAEHEVVARLLQGFSAEEIAARQHVSVETVRSHIRHAYGKLEVSSREQMFRRLEPYRVV